MRAILFRLVVFWCMGAASAIAQSIPGANPVMTVITDEGEQEETSYEGSAPVEIRFEARPENLGSYTAYYEWRFYTQGNESSPYIIRYDENTAYTFMTSGQTFIDLLITFVDGKDTINYEMDEPFVVSVSESKLEMPNAFSPNGDGINDVYKAKDGWQSIVSFKAAIFTRWGKKLYEWNDPDGGWDGKVNGHVVPDGAYYCVVQAKGADGKNYSIKKTVSVLTTYDEQSTGTEE
ncbi:putative uncharacterized protein [Prevotella sp. CAG:617]|nr:putative uncharacterized protein [Prevotella sp. CAG:617]